MKELAPEQLLMVHCAKSNKASFSTMKRIYARARALRPKYVKDLDVIVQMVDIIDEFRLMDLKRFFLEECNPEKNVWWGGEVKSKNQAVIDGCLSVLANSAVSKFPNYKESASYKRFKSNRPKKHLDNRFDSEY